MSDELPDCMMPDGADPCVGYRRLAARVRELEGARNGLDNIITITRTRAERAEAERDELNAGWQRTYDHDTKLLLERAERAEQNNVTTINEFTTLMVELRAERNALRALLRCCPFDYDGPMTDGQYRWVQDVRAALGGSHE